jgi:hypothetical protein
MFVIINFIATVLIAAAVAYHYYVFFDTKKRTESAIADANALTKAEVALAKQEDAAKVKAASDSLSQNILDTKTGLASQINTVNTATRTDLTSQINATNDVTTALQKQVNSNRDAFNKQLSGTTSVLQEQISNTNDALDKQFKTLGEQITSKNVNATNVAVEGGLAVGKTLRMAGNIFTSGPDRLHLTGDQELYVLNKNGLVVGKEWGGNGNANVQGDLKVGNNLNINRNLIQAGGERLHLWGDQELYVLNKKGLIVGKEWGGNGNANVQGNLKVGKAVNINGDLGINSEGERLHVWGEQELYVLNKKGLIVGKEWGGNGNASIQGDVNVGGKLCVDNTCINKDQLTKIIKAAGA